MPFPWLFLVVVVCSSDYNISILVAIFSKMDSKKLPQARSYHLLG